MTDTSEEPPPTPEEVTGIRVRLACPDCRWDGVVSLYEIGDGPEWCCPACDMCWASNAILGDDGLTNAQRALHRMAAEVQAERFAVLQHDPPEGDHG